MQRVDVSMKVGAVVLTLNEDFLIEECLKHLKLYVDFIVVLDGQSTDRTVEIAKKYADAVYVKPFYGSFAEERLFAQLAVPSDCQYILHCDADERFPKEFLENMKAIIAKNDVDSFRFPRINEPDKAEYPDYQVKLVKRWVTWRKPVHEIAWHPDLTKPIDQLSCKTLDYPITHIKRSEEGRKAILERWFRLEHRKVLVAFLVRDCEKWLNRFLLCLEQLEYLKEQLRFAIIEGNSKDDTWHMVNQFASQQDQVWFKKIDLDESLARHKRLAVLRNKLLEEALEDEEFVFWIDSDIVEFSPSLLRDLIKANVDVIAPYVLIEGTDKFYDHLAFRKDGVKFMFPDGFAIMELPKELFEVDSVGTCMLVRADVYRRGVRYPEDHPESEQVGFCELAKKKGFKIFVNPNLKVFHAELPRYGYSWH